MTRNTVSHFLVKGQRLAIAAILLAGLALSVSPVQVAQAATFVVDRTDDVASANACTATPNDCSLRGAIFAANNSVGFDTVQVPAMTFTLTLVGAGEGDLDINEDLEIIGDPAGTTIDGSDAAYDDRIFDIPTGVTATITNLTITGAVIAGANGGGVRVDTGAVLTIEDSTLSNNSANNGGGIANSGTLTLNNSTISGNTVVVNGGGISNLGTMTVTSSTFSNNTANEGGGISSSGTMAVTNSTITANVASSGGDGGGISNLGTMTIAGSTIASNSAGNNGGGVDSDTAATTNSVTNSTFHGNNSNRHGGGISNTTGTLTLNNVTIASNSADADASNTGNGGGIAVLGGTVDFGNTIIGDNVDSSPSSTVAPDCSGTLNSLDYNLIENTTTCSFTGLTANSIVGQGPNLGPLQDNGGGTETRALLAGSLAIDAGNPTDPPDPGTAACETTDQRGVARPQGAACDIGAYEAHDVQVSFSTAAQTVAESVGTVTVTAELTSIIGLNVTVPYTVSGTATGGTDHDLANGNITITAGSLPGSVTFNVTNDTLDEPNETVIVTMGTPTNAFPGSTTVQTITITDNDPPPTVNFSTATQTVAESVGTVTVTASLNTISGFTVTVPYTVSGTATGGGTDHNLADGNITITAGSLTGSVTFTVTNDSLTEPNETVIVTMGTPINAVKGTTTVQTITITDDDAIRIFFPLILKDAP